MRLARRQRIEGCRTSGPTRDDRLQTRDQRGASNGSQHWLTAVKLRRNTRGPKCACRRANAITCARQPTPAYCAFAASRVAALRLRLALDPATALPFGKLPEGSWPTRFVSQFVKGLDNFLLIEGIPVIQRLSQKGTQPNATAFLALTIQALIKLNCFDLYLLRQPLQGGEG
jgi:hypothetical protein